MLSANKVTQIVGSKFLKVTTTLSGNVEVAIATEHLKDTTDHQKVELVMEAQRKLVAAGIPGASDSFRLSRPPGRDSKDKTWRSWVHLNLKKEEAEPSASVEYVKQATQLAQLQAIMAMLEAGMPIEAVNKVRASLAMAEPAAAAESEAVADADAEAPI